jgi:putative SOS response-associated peptidase YedK
VAAVRLARETGDRELVMLKWGLIPFWAKDPGIGSRMINARSETAAGKPSFRAAFRRRRCLVLADGFYEWQKVEGGKQPHYIRLADGGPFAIAGLWEHWEGPDESVIQSCTLLTTGPNDLLRPLHNRMPVILDAGDYDLWLDLEVQDAEKVQPLLRPFSPEAMDAYPVSRWVNRPQNDDPRCIVAEVQGEDLQLPGL